MFRFQPKLDELFGPMLEGVDRDRFAYLFTHRQGQDVGAAMHAILDGLVCGQDEAILVYGGGQLRTRGAILPKGSELISGEMNLGKASLENWATAIHMDINRLRQEGWKIAAVVMDGVIDAEIAVWACSEVEEGNPNPINAFYRRLRGAVCHLSELPLIVRHPLKDDTGLPGGRLSGARADLLLSDSMWVRHCVGSRTLDMEFDSTVLLYQEGRVMTAVLGKIRAGAIYNRGEWPRVKL